MEKIKAKKLYIKLQEITKRHSKQINIIGKISKIMVFVGYCYTTLIMYFIGSKNLALVLIVILSLYMIFSKLERREIPW